jgi:DNA-binding Xre family transcriptional regulator
LWDLVRIASALFVFQARRALAFNVHIISGAYAPMSIQNMGYVRLRIRELADQKGWTLKEIAERSGVNYNTVKSYVQRDALNTVDLSAVFKIASAFEVTLEDLVEVLQD